MKDTVYNNSGSLRRERVGVFLVQTQQTGHDRLVSFAEFSKKQYKFGFQVRKSEALHDYLM